MGVFWFVALSVSSAAMVGAIAGIVATATPISREDYANGDTVGHEIAGRYGGLIMLSALCQSIAGTASGRLPGTSRRRDTPTP